MFRKVLAARERILGAEHPDTLATAGDLATSVSNQGKYAKAEKMQRAVLVAKTRVLGAQHPDTMLTAGNLALTLRGQGKHAEAENI